MFSLRYTIELTSSGPVSIPPTQSTSRGFGSSFMSGGLTYVYECMYCHKKFRRKKQSSTLNPHKTLDGWPCPGRTGYLVDRKY